VVEGQLIYDFGIDCLWHFSCKNLSNCWSKEGKPKWEMSLCAPSRRRRAYPRHAAHAPPRFSLARMPRPASARRSARGGTLLRRTEPFGPLPGCHAPCPHALAGGAASRHWLDGRNTSPPTPRRTPAMPRPMPSRGVDRSVAHRLHPCPAIKAPSSPLLARDTEPRCGHHCHRRRAPCSARACCHLNTPRASPNT
jgi:hypothetical protein